ncbi:hypothetical protein E2562_031339 [Oryza meyeriana var. granulata]|uniref:Uncharacterized protein n=1 Tax=Oryza meyeriana var. granulata TaxID=110450 RepID=A0A6G1D9L9_9ORYZ|nr:hypothetical protein E2562_031339 [Oryza meyeriana var. granulata]
MADGGDVNRGWDDAEDADRGRDDADDAGRSQDNARALSDLHPLPIPIAPSRGPSTSTVAHRFTHEYSTTHHPQDEHSPRHARRGSPHPPVVDSRHGGRPSYGWFQGTLGIMDRYGGGLALTRTRASDPDDPNKNKDGPRIYEAGLGGD